MRLAGIIDKIDDLINPIVVKEIRQSINSRTIYSIIIGVLLLELGGLLIFMSEGVRGSSSGQGYFVMLMVILMLGYFLGVGMSAAGRFANERDKSSMDLMHTTVLSPYSIIWGKIFSSMVMVVFIFSLCVPFMCVSYFLKGIDIVTILSWCYISFVIALPTVTGCLLLGTLGSSKGMRGLIVFVVVFVLWTGIGPFLFRYGGVSPAIGGLGDSLAALIWTTFYSLAISGLCYFAAVSLISHVSSNRAFCLRYYIAVLWLSSLVIVVLYALHMGSADPLAVWFVQMSLIAVVVTGFAPAERLVQSRRVLKSVPRSEWRRLLHFMFSSGAVNAILFGVCMMLLNCAVFFLATNWHEIYGGSGNDHSELLQIFSGIFAYILFYSSLAITLKLGFNRFFPNINGMVYSLFVVGVCMLIPVIIEVFHSFNRIGYSSELSYMFILSPFIFTNASMRSVGIIVSAALAVLGLVLNFRLIKSSLKLHRRLETEPVTVVTEEHE